MIVQSAQRRNDRIKQHAITEFKYSNENSSEKTGDSLPDFPVTRKLKARSVFQAETNIPVSGLKSSGGATLCLPVDILYHL